MPQSTLSQANPAAAAEQVEYGVTRLGIATKWWVLVAIGVGTFMSALDGSVVNTVLPVIRADFGASVSTIGWVVSIYLLVVSAMLLTFGRLGDIYGHKRVYLAGFVLFVASSVAAGLAPTPGALIAARAVQALGGAMLQSNSPAILTTTFPGKQRGQALGLQGTMTYMGVMVGPPLGGWLATQFSWRAIFYINVPVGLLAVWLAWLVVPSRTSLSARERFDPLGALSFMLGLTALLLALNRGRTWGWGSPGILGLLAATLVGLGFFVLFESRVRDPLLDLSLFRRRMFSASALSAIFNYMCVYSIIFLVPFYLIEGRGLSPDRAGLLIATQPLMMAIVAPVSGSLSDRFGSRWLASFGMAFLGVGLWLLSRLGPASPPGQIALALAIAGVGNGSFAPANNSALMGAAPRERQGVAASVLASGRNVGMMLGVALAEALFSARLAAFTGANLPNPTVRAVGVTFQVVVGLAVLGILTSSVRGQAVETA